MADIKTAYGSKTAITLTPASLADGAGHQSTVVDNTTDKFLDVLVRIQTNGAAGGTGSVEVYVYSALGDTTYTDGATGTDGAFTAANRKNSRYLGSVQMNEATGVVAMMPGIAAAFGGTLPSKWGLIIINSSGAALSATAGDHVFEYQGIYATSV